MNSLPIKRALARLWALRDTDEPRRVILYYHAVGDGPCALPVELFRAQIEWLAAHTEVLGLDEMLGCQGRMTQQVSIGFDDGYASVASGAGPVLRALGLPATVYLNTGWIGDSSRRASDPSLGHYPGECFMTWKDVASLVEQGWTIGSHGVEHADLTAVDEARLAVELSVSKQGIESTLGTSCKHFAYTWGRYDPRVRRAVMAAGYATAASALHGPLLGSGDPFTLPRIDIARHYTLPDVQAIVRGDWDYLGYIQRVRRLSVGLARFRH